MPGIRLKLTIPESIKAIAATKNGTVSFIDKLISPTIKPNITKVVTKATGLTMRLAVQLLFKIKLNQPPDNMAMTKPTKKA